MDLVESLYLDSLINEVSNQLFTPTIVILILLILFAIGLVGAVIIEALVERRRYRAYIPETIAQLIAAEPEDFTAVIEESRLTRFQKDDLQELIGYLYLPETARTQVAERLFATEEARFKKSLMLISLSGVTATSLGVIGTLIPLGPAMELFKDGDIGPFIGKLMIALSTTVVGLAVNIVCQWVGSFRKMWYEDYLTSLRNLFETLLAEATRLHEEGYRFPEGVYVYDKKGKKAHRESVASATSKAYVETVSGKRRAESSNAPAQANPQACAPYPYTGQPVRPSQPMPPVGGDPYPYPGNAPLNQQPYQSGAMPPVQPCNGQNGGAQ